MKDRVQLLNPKTNRWVKIDIKIGEIIGHKKDDKPYKNIEKRGKYNEPR